MSAGRLDALIVTALQLERHAVRAHLDGFDTRAVGAARVDIGRFVVGAATLRVGVIECGPGNVDAAALTTTTATKLKPRVVLMVGVSGGLKDMRIGDIVASSKIHWAEPGRSEDDLIRPRPDLGPVSVELVQIARTVAADNSWQSRRLGAAVNAPRPRAIVAPIVVGERVVASSQSADARRIRATFSDAVAVAMEDVGAAKAAAVAGAAALSIRAVSDLLDGKAAADATGSQPIAAANAAAFAFELLARLPPTASVGDDSKLNDLVTELSDLAADLYPQGPADRSIWERAGGDPSRIQVTGIGRWAWWEALRVLARGGGGANISLSRLVAVMLEDYPGNPALADLACSVDIEDPDDSEPG